MKVGLVLGMRNPEPWQRPWSEYYREVIDQVRHAEALGFDSVWLSEHHFSDDGYCPSPLVVAAGIATATERITIGTSILVLPLHDPVRVAEDAATVDLLSGGRFVLGVGAGHRPVEFDTFDVPLRNRGARLGEGIELLRQCWADAPVDFRGEHYDVSGMEVHPRPRGGKPIPIWVGARSEAATRRAGRLGDGLLLSRGRRQVEWFHEAAVEHGRDPASLALATMRIVHVADSHADAVRTIGPHLLYHENLYRRWFREAGDFQHETELADYGSVDDLPLDRYVLGSPQQVVEEINQLADAYGFGHLLLWGRLAGLSHAEAMRSMERVAAEVMPGLGEGATP